MQKIKENIKVREFIDSNGRVLYEMHNGTMTDEEYDALKPLIGFLNGCWREKTKCFVFGYNPQNILKDMIDMYHTGYLDRGNTEYKDWSGEVPISLLPFIYREWQERIHYFPTPDKLAKKVVDMCEIEKGDIVLEPSAGQGALLKYVPEGVTLQVVEKDEHNCKVLRSKGYKVNNCSFEDYAKNKCMLRPTKVIMNPPFFNHFDMKHIVMAYEMLKKGGTLVAIMSENNLYYEGKVVTKFWEFLKQTNASLTTVPFGEFANSGTMVYTVLIRIVKE